MTDGIRLTISAAHSEYDTFVPARPGSRGRGRAKHVHVAHIGPVRVEETSRTKLSYTAAAAVEMFLRAWREPKVLVYGDRICVLQVLASADGPCFEYAMYELTGRRCGSTMLGADTTWDQLEASARWNLAQIGTDWMDDDSVRAGVAFLYPRPEPGWTYTPEEFYRYAAWQRAARWAQENGELDPHDFACQHEREDRFQVPRKEAA